MKFGVVTIPSFNIRDIQFDKKSLIFLRDMLKKLLGVLYKIVIYFCRRLYLIYMNIFICYICFYMLCYMIDQLFIYLSKLSAMYSSE